MAAFGAIIATLIALVVGVILITLVKNAFWAITGRSQPLQPKDDGKDDPGRGQFVPEESKELSRSDFANISAPSCPLHDAPYLGYTEFTRHKSATIGGGSKDYLCIIGCLKCFAEANVSRKFGWTRKNYDKHPVWASAQIYPHLLGDIDFEIRRAFVAFDEPASQALAMEWIASPDPATRADGIEALRFRKSDINIALLKTLLRDEASFGPHEKVSTVAFHMLHAWGFEYDEIRKISNDVRAQTAGL